MAHDVFISYQQADKAIADAVCHRMEAAGVRCWIAPRDVAGEHWDDDVVDALTAAKVLVLIFSAAACASRDVVNEVKTAIDAGVTVIPFRIEDIRPTGGLGLHLVRVHWLDALTPPREAAIDQLIDRAKRNLPAAPEDDDQAAWRDAKARHTVAAYDHYLTTWPTGIGAHEAAEARRKLNEQIAEAERKAEDEAAWRDAKALHTVAAYDHYLTTWPTGIGALEAAAARRKAEAERAVAARRKAEEGSRPLGLAAKSRGRAGRRGAAQGRVDPQATRWAYRIRV